MATNTAATGQPHRSNATVITAVSLIAAVIAAVLIYQAASTQNTLQTNKTSATQQRTDTEQVTCALWAALRAGKTLAVDQAIAAEATRVCATLPTPLPSSR